LGAVEFARRYRDDDFERRCAWAESQRLGYDNPPPKGLTPDARIEWAMKKSDPLYHDPDAPRRD
jgi:hypothetical protein